MDYANAVECSTSTVLLLVKIRKKYWWHRFCCFCVSYFIRSCQRRLAWVLHSSIQMMPNCFYQKKLLFLLLVLLAGFARCNRIVVKIIWSEWWYVSVYVGVLTTKKRTSTCTSWTIYRFIHLYLAYDMSANTIMSLLPSFCWGLVTKFQDYLFN